MTEQHSDNRPPDLSWLSNLRAALGAVDIVLEATPNDPAAPRFEYGKAFPQPQAVVLDPQEQASEKWRDIVRSHLSSANWKVCLANLIAVPPRAIRGEVDGFALWDSAAFLAGILKNSPEGQIVAALMPVAVLNLQRSEPLRGWLSKAHSVEWIIFLGSEAAQLIGAYPGFGLTLVVIRSGLPVVESPRILRLVDLTSVSAAKWLPTLRAAAKRGGGEVGPSIVIRNPVLDGGPWTYQRFSKCFAESRSDAERLGSLRRLGELAESLSTGLHRAVEAHRIELHENGSMPDGAIACFGGRSIGRKGELTSPVCGVLREGLSDDVLLRPGDVLVRTIVNPSSMGSSVFAAVVTDEVLPATFDRTCICIRWRDEIPQESRNLLAAYLNSTHARHWLTAHGVQLTLNLSVLEKLEVPDPSADVVSALQVLSDAEQQYRAWANDVAVTRLQLFTEGSLAKGVPALLARQRTEVERLRAARDAGSIDYRIRNYYPHPIALRWESILQAEPGKAKIEAILDCAEHLLTLLAVMAILQEPSTTHGPIRTRLLSFVRDGALHLDWGKCFALLKEGANVTARDPNPLSLRFPELAELATAIVDGTSAWSKAERELRDRRNNFSHLQRFPDTELTGLSDELLQNLNCLLESTDFISTLPLVHVVDYELDPIITDRFATFQYLEGISPVFRREKRRVPAEVPRGAVGFLNQRGDFISAFPWLTMNICPMCKRPEIFVFNRYQSQMVTSIAMETGHPQELPTLLKSVATAIGEDR